MKIITEVINRKRCVGCGVCYNVCSKKAISMQLDNEGFYKPFINASNCVECGLCDNSCPVLNCSYDNTEAPDCYAMMANDNIRSVSSSGGAFTVIANAVLKKGGVVCGVAYNANCKKTHYVIIDSPKLLCEIRGSKYIMCDTGEIYKEVKRKINSRQYVLFSGLPCHVAGLKSFLKEDFKSEFLLTVDLICHGIGSVKAFDYYMRDVHSRREITQLGFKDKRFGWHASMTIEFKDGGFYNMPCETDPFFISYLNGLNKNRCCGNCKFAHIPRQGDLTIGDFWGINNYNKDYNDGKGTSVVLFNNEKGKQFLEAIEKESKLFKKVPLEYAINGNANLIKSPSVKVSNSQFLRKLDTRRYPDLVKWGFDDNRYDIGIVGIPIFPNFGGTLTYYSLYRSLKDMGYSVALFSRPRSTGRPPVIPEEVYNVCPFDKSDLKLDFKDKAMMGNYANANCESFVVGSDQLFNSDLYKSFGEIVTLDWVADNHRKIAYAASFGHNFFWGPESERAKMAYYMQKFDAFSVREEEGVELAKKVFGVEAQWVLDPVFLCDTKHYETVSETSAVKESMPHIFAYILDPTPDKEDILYYAEKTLNLKTELYSEMLYKPSSKLKDDWQSKFKHKLFQGKTEDRLYSLIHSDFVIADSFHGICFAIIFNKPFVAILNPLRGASRFYTILGKLHLLDRMVTSVEEVRRKAWLFEKKCDFSEAHEIIAAEKERCLAWLKNAVDPIAETKKSFSAEDIINEKIKRVDKHLLFNDIKVNASLSDKKLHLNKNIYDYLDSLNSIKQQLIIFISVKDTPGFALNEKISTKMSALGLKNVLSNKHWHSYVAVISGGKVINESISIKDERVAYTGTLPCGKVKVVSRSFNSGNVAFIGINDIDYSENKRGLNIVVYDKTIGEVIDSVSFDTHDGNIPYFRYNKRFASVMPVVHKYELAEIDIINKSPIKPPLDFKHENLSIFYCCKTAIEKCRGRNIVLWEDNQQFRDILKEHFNTSVNYVISEKVPADSSIPYLHPSDIKDKKDEFYIIIPDKKWDIADEIKLKQLGFNDVNDYIYHNIRPIVLKNRNYKTEPYHDVYMNSIIGDFSEGSTIIIRGYNNIINLGTNPSIKAGSNLFIDCSSNSDITIGDSVRYAGNVEIVLLNNFDKIIRVGNNTVFIDNQLRLVGDIGTTELIIKNRTTFNTNTCLHVNSGKKLVIGEDVMFSLNIRVLCGDGHSIFDVNTGKNINSIPKIIDERYNTLSIGDHVWVGMNATILTGSIIGSGAIVGANSLVKGEFPNNCAIGGNPAKLIKKNIAWSRRDCSQATTDCGIEYYNLTANDISQKKVLVLGGTRFMGVKLVKKLIKHGYDVTILTRGIHKDTFGTKVKRIICDRLNEQSVINKLEGKQYDIIFDNSAYCSNAVKNVLSHVKCDRYIQVSSVAIYPSEGDTLKNERDYMSSKESYELSNPTKDYAKGKRDAECIALQEFGSISMAIVRIPFVVETENMDNPDLNSRLMFYVKALIEQTPINVDEPDYICSFIRTDEEADFLIQLAESEYNGIVNVSSEDYVTVQEIMNYLENKTGKKFILSKSGLMHPFNKKHFTFKSNGFWFDLKVAKSIGYKPEKLESWLYNLLDYYVESFD